MFQNQAFLLSVIFLLFAASVHTEKVLLLAVEGLTPSLLSRVATPALDRLASRGSLSRLVPEFPSETLPTLAAIATGQHTETTGILDSEVRGPGGETLQPADSQFWASNNLTTLWDLANSAVGGRAGTVRWPGAEVGFGGAGPNPLRWSQVEEFDIEEDVAAWEEDEELEGGAEGRLFGRRRRRMRRGLGGTRRTTSRHPGGESTQAVELQERKESDEERQVTEKEKVEEAEVVTSEANELILDFAASFNKSTDREWLMWADQVSTVAGWLGRKEDPVELVLMYVEEPGSQIRSWGPESDQADFAVMKVDQLIALLMEQLSVAGLEDSVNLLVTGVHGFCEVSTDKVFDISGSIGDTSYIHGHSPVLNIKPPKDEELDTYAKLQTSSDKDKFDLYTRRLVPEEFHYSGSSRVSEIVLVAKEGFAFAFDFWTEVKRLNRVAGRQASLDNKYGKAGYDPRIESMEAALLMMGPGLAIQPVPEQLSVSVAAVDLFPLVAHLLRLPPPPNNGTLSPVRSLLRSPPSRTVEAIQKTLNYYTEHDRLPQTVSLLATSTLLLIVFICCCACALRRRRSALGAAHNYKYSAVKSNRRTEGRVDGSEEGETGDKVGLLTSALMEEDLSLEQEA